MSGKKISDKEPTETPSILEKEPIGEEKKISEELVKKPNINEIIVMPSEAKVVVLLL